MNLNRSSNFPANELTTNIPEVRWWRELAIVAQMIMELAWIVPWYRSLTIGTYLAEPWRVMIFYFFLMNIIFWLARGMNNLKLRNRYRRIILGAVFVAASLLSLRFLLYFSRGLTFVGLIKQPIAAFNDVYNLIPDEFIIILFTLLVSYRGVSIASQHTSPTDLLFRFKVGFGMLVLFILMNTLLTGEVPGDFLYLFIFSGLVAIGSARMAVSERLRGGSRSQFDRKWVLGLVAGALFVVLVGFVSAQITSLPIFEIFVQILSLIGALLLGIVLVLLAPVILLMIAGLTWLIKRSDLAAAFPNFISDMQQALNNLNNFANQLLKLADRFLPDLSISKPILLWSGLIGFIILGLLLLSVRWLMRNYAGIRLDEIDSLLESGDLLKLFQQVLLRNIKNLGQRIDAGLFVFRRDRRQAAARIRQIYQQLIAASQELGVSKPEAATPLEFLPSLIEVFPGHQAELERITTAYNKVRYGELPEDLTEMQGLEADWQSLLSDANARLGRGHTPHR